LFSDGVIEESSEGKKKINKERTEERKKKYKERKYKRIQRYWNGR